MILYVRALKKAGESDALRAMLEDAEQRNNLLTRNIDKEEITNHASDRLSNILTPLRENIDAFSRMFVDARIQDAKDRQILQDRLEKLMRLNVDLGEDAKALSKALRGNSKIQGDWGESVLHRLLEKAGLKEGVNFIAQMSRDERGNTIRTEQGNLLRPDFVILLPNDRKLIIDSKVSLTDYVRMQDADDESEIEILRKRHIASVKKHIDELATKNYAKEVKGAAEHVLMFMPVEGAYLEAYSSEERLWEYAFAKKIVIISPANLASVLLLTEQLWRREKQNSNAEEIARQAGLLYDRLVMFAEEFTKIKTSLFAAQKAYDECAHRLSSGHLSITSRAEKLRNLGAKTSKRLPEII
ncbi:MAG: DNA recombination protein RmuC [Prevotella sp.]|nr:DNA recombination protein RmuC [Bacteroides sp.]MCM1366679.1 DNA recombination protein RmuC [Prevotella sp.]